MDLSEPRQFGPYLLLDQIAVGGMAEIYLAKTHGVAGFEKFLALKLIHPNYADDDQFVEMLIEEAKIAVSLNHVNIAQVFDLGRHENRYYISMEYVDGADLFKVMRALSEKGVDVPIDVAAYIVQELCTGLDYAHRKRDPQGRALSIVHRDISPQNVLLSTAGEIKIVDFGIAKAASRTLRTQAGVIKGKYFYMSPEQAWGDPIDHRTDIFSAGIILYEILTGQMLYLEEDMHRLLDMVRKAEIAPPTRRRPDIPRELERVVMKALAKHPEERFQSAQEFQVALTNFLFSYASDFTPERVAELLRTALEEREEEEEEATRAEPVASVANQRRAYAQLPRKAGHETSRLEVDALMSRADYRPDEDKSVLFRLDSSVDESDRGEATMISSPPIFGDAFAGAHAPSSLDTGQDHAPRTFEAPIQQHASLAPPAAFIDGDISSHELGDWAGRSDPTVIGDSSPRSMDDETMEATLLPEHPAAGEKTTVDGMMPAPPEVAPPHEVIIPRGDHIEAGENDATYVGGSDARSPRSRRQSRLGVQAAEARAAAGRHWTPALPSSDGLDEKTWPVDSREQPRHKQPSRPLPRA
ncbi:MAG: serine/threonine protein kinase, partial [Myxococcales bacterium]|nr:serine/threonine protein kinase [Myxococcales bacterium]